MDAIKKAWEWLTASEMRERLTYKGAALLLGFVLIAVIYALST